MGLMGGNCDQLVDGIGELMSVVTTITSLFLKTSLHCRYAGKWDSVAGAFHAPQRQSSQPSPCRSPDPSLAKPQDHRFSQTRDLGPSSRSCSMRPADRHIPYYRRIVGTRRASEGTRHARPEGVWSLLIGL